MKGIGVPLSECAKIHELHCNGTPMSDLMEKYHVHQATIYRILQEKTKVKRKRGRPRKLTNLQRLHIINKMHRNPKESANKLSYSFEFPVSAQTIRHELQKAGFTHKRIKPRKVLSEIHKEKWREFVISHITWTSDDGHEWCSQMRSSGA